MGFLYHHCDAQGRGWQKRGHFREMYGRREWPGSSGSFMALGFWPWVEMDAATAATCSSAQWSNFPGSLAGVPSCLACPENGPYGMESGERWRRGLARSKTREIPYRPLVKSRFTRRKVRDGVFLSLLFPEKQLGKPYFQIFAMNAGSVIFGRVFMVDMPGISIGEWPGEVMFWFPKKKIKSIGGTALGLVVAGLLSTSLGVKKRTISGPFTKDSAVERFKCSFVT